MRQVGRKTLPTPINLSEGDEEDGGAEASVVEVTGEVEAERRPKKRARTKNLTEEERLQMIQAFREMSK